MKNGILFILVGLAIFHIEAQVYLPIVTNETEEEVAVVTYESNEREYLTASKSCNFIFSRSSTYDQRRYGLSCNGETILPPIYRIKYGKRERYLIMVLHNEMGVFDVLDRKWSIPLSNQEIISFSQSAFIVARNGETSLISSSGEMLIPFAKQTIVPIGIEKRYYKVNENSSRPYKYGVYDIEKRDFTLDKIYSEIALPDNNNGLLIINDGERADIIHLSGRKITEKSFDEIQVNRVTEKRFVARKKTSYGVIDSVGNMLLPFKYKDIEILSIGRNLIYLIVDKADDVFLLNDKFDLISPSNFQGISVRQENYCIVKIDDKYGLSQYVSGEIHEVLPATYDSINLRYSKLYTERNNTSNYQILQENLSTETPYSEVKTLDDGRNIGMKDGFLTFFTFNQDNISQSTPFVSLSRLQSLNPDNRKDKLYKAKLNTGKYQLLSKDFKNLTAYSFYDILSFYKGFLFVIDDTEKIGVYSMKNNQFVVPYSYDSVHYNGARPILVSGRDHYYLLDDKLMLIR